MAGLLWSFWDMHGYITEGRKWLADALATPGDVSPVIKARALSAAATLLLIKEIMNLHQDAL